MHLINKIVKKNPNLYFVEGFYEKHYLIMMGSSIKEVKISYELLNLLKISHDKGISIGEAYKNFLHDEVETEDSNLLLKQINWLNEKGMIDLI